MKEPKYTCPLIDEVISYLNDIHSSSVKLLSLLSATDLPAEVQDAMKDFDHEIHNSFKLSGWNSSGFLIDKMEEIREANSELRSWGTHYKDLYEEIEDVESQLEEATETIISLNLEVRDLENENYSLKKEVEDLEMEVDSWKEYSRNCQEY